jgi:hypothetical protein
MYIVCKEDRKEEGLETYEVPVCLLLKEFTVSIWHAGKCFFLYLHLISILHAWVI